MNREDITELLEQYDIVIWDLTDAFRDAGLEGAVDEHNKKRYLDDPSQFLDKNSIRTSNDLKEPYIQFLNKYQSKILSISSLFFLFSE